MRIYAFANQKGGVGKTTLAVHLAILGQQAGFETLLVDLDQQGSATYLATGDPHRQLQVQDGTALDLWKPEAELVVEESPIFGFDLLQATAALDRVDDDLGAGLTAISSLRERASQYDLVVLDCPPAPGVRQIAALLAADVHVVPVTPDRLGTQGIAAALQLHQNKIAQRNPNLLFQIVVNRLKANSSTNKAIADGLRERLGDAVCPEYLFEREDVKRGLNNGKPYWQMTRDSQSDTWHGLFQRLLHGTVNQVEESGGAEEEPADAQEDWA